MTRCLENASLQCDAVEVHEYDTLYQHDALNREQDQEQSTHNEVGNKIRC